jgi:hypothetical protein
MQSFLVAIRVHRFAQTMSLMRAIFLFAPIADAGHHCVSIEPATPVELNCG